MVAVSVVIASASAFCAGSLLGSAGFQHYREGVRQQKARASVGVKSVLDAASVSLECRGVSAWIIERAVAQTLQANVRASQLRSGEPTGRRKSPFRNFENIVAKAGLEAAITASGAWRVQVTFALAAGLAGAIGGAFFSLVLSVIGALAGALWGWTALRRALLEEMHARSFVAEKQLSHLVEVMTLGLKSGMSFDRALELYHHSFEGSLSRSLALAQAQWSHGLVERSEALRQVASSYDSPLFDRLAENIIRSLRFGTSLTENLGVIASEARAIRKAKLEEKVAKAPVKMLLPVGTLILPAMLVLILGPIMLDLMEGF